MDDSDTLSDAASGASGVIAVEATLEQVQRGARVREREREGRVGLSSKLALPG